MSDIRMPSSTGRTRTSTGKDGVPFVATDSKIYASSSLLLMWITSTRMRTGREGMGLEETGESDYCMRTRMVWCGELVNSPNRCVFEYLWIITIYWLSRQKPPLRPRTSVVLSALYVHKRFWY